MPDPSLCTVGFEYFTFEQDGYFRQPDGELLGTAAEEMSLITEQTNQEIRHQQSETDQVKEKKDKRDK